MKLFGLIDSNNFYVACEQIFRPDLAQKPVVVLSNNDGCFISRSNEAKKLGIPMGAPLFKYQHLIKQHNIQVFSANFAFYGDISTRLMKIISNEAPKVEVYSIDEAFMDLTGLPFPEKTAFKIRQQVFQNLGLPTCIGLAPTKTLAKLANHLAKKNLDYQGICFLKESNTIQDALKYLPVEEIWGVGRQLSARLREKGIITGYDLQQVDFKWMRQHFTVVGERLVQELNGISCLTLDQHHDCKKSIQVSRSFAKNVNSFDELRANIAIYATRLGEKLREQNLKTTTLIIYIKTNRFKENYYKGSQIINLPQAINDDANLIKACGRALSKIFKSQFAYKKAGVMALDLISESQHQYSLFSDDKIDSSKTAQLLYSIDQLNKKYGAGTIHRAACGTNLSWKDQKDFKSPAYTTNWHELPVVYAK